MNVLILSGSRNPQGQTAQAAAAFGQALQANQAAVETVFLPPLRLERCRQCDENGWGRCRTEGRCSVVDDFAGLVAKAKAADLVVFATPVYFGDLSESLKAFTDRLRRTCMHAAGKDGIGGKPAIGICVAGGGGGGAAACCTHLERVLTTCGFALADLVPVRRQNLPVKLRALADCAKDIAEAACSSAAQIKKS
jgi:multimeric flavodoxin WrbA